MRAVLSARNLLCFLLCIGTFPSLSETSYAAATPLLRKAKDILYGALGLAPAPASSKKSNLNAVPKKKLQKQSSSGETHPLLTTLWAADPFVVCLAEICLLSCGLAMPRSV